MQSLFQHGKGIPNVNHDRRSPHTSVAAPQLARHHADCLYRSGYVLLRRWRPAETTAMLGQSVGTVVDIPTLLRSEIPVVQTLKPRTKAISSPNRYSGEYGLSEFPLHTDLAHWARPPRYFMLRCRNGSQSVDTRLLAASVLLSVLDITTLRRALVRPRRASGDAPLTLLPLMFRQEGVLGFRWDPLFLVPMNEPANRVAETMRSQSWDQSKCLALVEPGDTLLVDNWRILHGRSEVSPADADRRIERVYLSEIIT